MAKAKCEMCDKCLEIYIDDYVSTALEFTLRRTDESYSPADLEDAYCNVMRELSKVCGCKMSRLERMILEQYKNFMDELVPDYEEIVGI